MNEQDAAPAQAPEAPPKPRHQANERAFACDGCGALQTFQPGTRTLECAFCGHETPIPERASAQIREYPLREALDRLAQAGPVSPTATRCPSCAAQFQFDPKQHAGECPFCATPIVVNQLALEDPDSPTRIHPKSLLPFDVDEQGARDGVSKWLGKLIFAPPKLRRYGRVGGLHGVYLPYWTYDSRTRSSYTGERGTVYYVNVPVTTVRNGRTVTVNRREARVRWRRVSGTVARRFDDVLVGASKSLPRTLTDKLAPWDLAALVPYDERYLSGFRSEVYEVSLDQGFEVARGIMGGIIRRDVLRDIGGDRQRVHSVQTEHFDTTFKHLLLPVWTASYEYRSKRFRLAVNARTGRVVGERPWHWPSIVLAVALGAGVIGGALWWAHRAGLLQG
ncbi:MAG: primosomal protein N' (replication factor Y) - superfamily II helicase [Pseudomonadota bacterium]